MSASHPVTHNTRIAVLHHRWYGSGEPRKVFVERKTHRESWKGEESVKERFTLDASQVVPFLEMDYDWAKVGLGVRVESCVCTVCVQCVQCVCV